MLASSGGSDAHMGDGSKSHEDQIRDKLLPHIQNAYALENQLVETLEHHANEAADMPQMRSMILQHLEETKQHRARIEQRLNAYGEKPSAVKDLGSSLMGNMMGAMSGMRADQLARIARDEYVSEHMEIAAYTLLITTAQAFGDMETVEAAQLNLQDEVAMQQRLLENMPQVCLFNLQQEGYNVQPMMQQDTASSWNATA
jgi:ferritin-like metal-binding protein YciE